MSIVRGLATRYQFAPSVFGAAVACLVVGPPMARAAEPDGLQRFEKLLPVLQSELKSGGGGSMSYGHGVAIGRSGFEIDDVTFVVPADTPGGGPSKITIKRVLVEDLDFDRIDLAHPDAPTSVPYFIKMSVQGLNVDGDLQQRIGGLGLPGASLDLALDYRYDEPGKVLMLNKLELRLPGLASVDLTMVLDKVPPPGPDTPKQAADTAVLRNATLTFDDHSLLRRVVPIASVFTGMPPEDNLSTFRDSVSGMLGGQSAASVANADALVSFAMDWQAPKGPLSVQLTGTPSAGFAELIKIDSPDAAQKIFGLVISYPGTRAGIATASAPATAPNASGGQSTAIARDLCTANNRVFVRDKDDGSLSAATVLEATGKGRCIVRMDGAVKGDDTVASAGDLRRWSIDGPGQPLDVCERGKAVFALSDGAWSPGKVTAKGKAGKCEVTLDGQDDSEVLPLAAVRLATEP